MEVPDIFGALEKTHSSRMGAVSNVFKEIWDAETANELLAGGVVSIFDTLLSPFYAIWGVGVFMSGNPIEGAQNITSPIWIPLRGVLALATGTALTLGKVITSPIRAAIGVADAIKGIDQQLGH